MGANGGCHTSHWDRATHQPDFCNKYFTEKIFHKNTTFSILRWGTHQPDFCRKYFTAKIFYKKKTQFHRPVITPLIGTGNTPNQCSRQIFSTCNKPTRFLPKNSDCKIIQVYFHYEYYAWHVNISNSLEVLACVVVTCLLVQKLSLPLFCLFLFPCLKSSCVCGGNLSLCAKDKLGQTFVKDFCSFFSRVRARMRHTGHRVCFSGKSQAITRLSIDVQSKHFCM